MRKDKSVPTCFLITLLTLVLTCNILVFDSEFFVQLIGTSMGTRAAPNFACLFMGDMEFIMLQSWTGLQPKMRKRYIDAIFLLWTGTEKELLDFVAHLNNLHTLLKFKVDYNFQSKSVEVLDKIIQ